MELHFTGRNIDVTPALKNYTTDKFQKLERHRSHISKVNVTFHIENISHVAEASLHFDGTDFHATATADDMYPAIDALIDKLMTQITKHKEKTEGHR
jgi:putative sigma-54 modulation protein